MIIFISDLCSCLVKRVTFNKNSNSDAANQLLYSIILDRVASYHGHRVLPLTKADNLALPQLLMNRPRDPSLPHSIFSNTIIG